MITRIAEIKRWAIWLLLGTILTGSCLLAGYQRLFSTFAPYDDEGYVMLSLESFSSGYRLYDETYTQYGPAPYVLVAPIHWIFSLPFSHDVTRFKTLMVWFFAASAGGYLIFRITQSRWWGLIGFGLSFLHLERLAMEPGHPQEICLLAMAAAFCLIVHLQATCGADNNRWCCLGLGLTVAVAALTKVNLGGLLGLSLAWGLVWLAPRGRIRNLLIGVFAAISILAPLVLAKHHAVSWKGIQLPAVVLFSVGAICMFRQKVPVEVIIRWRDMLWFLTGIGMATACFITAILIHGTSGKMLLHGIILQHLRFVDTFYEQPPFFQPALPCACLAFCAAILISRHSSQPFVRGLLRILSLAAIALLLAVVLRHSTETYQPLRHGATDRGMAAILMSFATVYGWLIVSRPIPTAGHSSESPGYARWILAVAAILLPLAIYPVPGTQTAIGSWSTLLCLLVFVADSLRDGSLWFSRSDRLLERFTMPAVMTALVVTLLLRDWHLTEQRNRLVPLNLPGASRLRLPPELVAKQHWMVDQIRLRASTFLCMPSGYNSLYFWACQRPPTALNTTMWPDLLNTDEQLCVIAALESRRDICVIHETTEPPAVRRDAPLEQYLRKHFHPVDRFGTVEVWERDNAFDQRLMLQFDIPVSFADEFRPALDPR